MNVLIACEFSGIVREEFNKLGHNAWSCDLVESEKKGNHLTGDIFQYIGPNKYNNGEGWDLMIAHPPCTYLTVTGNKWYYHPDDKDKPLDERRPHPRFPNRQECKLAAIDFFKKLANAPIDKICVENPVGIMSTNYKKPNQIIQPYEYGHVEAKKTCLWLKNLPLLKPTKIVEPEYVTFKSGKRMAKWYVEAASKPPAERTKIRNRTFTGIAEAMANQWGR